MRDYLPSELRKRRYVEAVLRELFRLYGYEEVETPTVEHYELLAAKAGEDTRKAMYAFKDLGGRMVALRPEGTAPIARLVATKLRTAPKPLRLGYIWDFYRYDEPQLGRFRRFYQGGFELLGASKPEADAEVLILAIDLIKRLGFKAFFLKVGNVNVLRVILATAGLGEDDQNFILGLADKKRYDEALTRLRELKVPDQTVELVSTLFKTRGSRVVEVIETGTRLVKDYEGAVKALEALKTVLGIASTVFPDVEFHVDLGFARGLEYYTGLIFEVFVKGLDIAVIGGGRYDKLVELYGGEVTPAVGCSPGIDRITIAMDREGLLKLEDVVKVVYIVPTKSELLGTAMSVAYKLRVEDLPAEVEVEGRGVSKALAYANSKGFPYVIILGAEEIREGKVILRDMRVKSQRTLRVEELAEATKSE